MNNRTRRVTLSIQRVGVSEPEVTHLGLGPGYTHAAKTGGVYAGQFAHVAKALEQLDDESVESVTVVFTMDPPVSPPTS